MTSVTITNALPGYEDTVLVSENAAVKVHYADENGKPIEGAALMLSITSNVKPTKNTTYEVKGSPSSTTNANGDAAFSIGCRDSQDIKDSDATASYNYTIKTVADGKEVKTGILKFASLSISGIEKTSDTKVLSSNFADPDLKHDVNTKGIVDDQKSGNDIEYVYSQQVSTADENKVTFSGGLPMITLPSEKGRAVYGEQNVSESVNEYHTYENSTDTARIAKLEVDPTELEYATLRFKNIRISEHTRMVITAHKNEADAKSGNEPQSINGNADGGKKVVVDGKSIKDDRGVQIPLNKTELHELWFRVVIESAGQVNTASRSYVWDKIEYMYKSNSKRDAQIYTGATVEWSIVPTLMSEERDITHETDILNALDNAGANEEVVVQFKGKKKDRTVERVTYCVPSFPRTGNAVITTYDKNNNVIDYYAYPAINKSLLNGGKPIDKNVIAGENENVLAFYENGKKVDENYRCYLISEQEAHGSTGEITAQDGKTVTVNATKTGSTLLKGSVMVDGEPIQKKLESYGYDDVDATVYTSVQWNPVAKKTDGAGYIALKGQNITVTAQLVDKNGNPVSSKDVEVSFRNDFGAISRTQGAKVAAFKEYGNNKATVVTNEQYTDSNGQAKLVLNSGEIATLEGIAADAVSNKQYSVLLTINGENTPSEKIDLYWIDADIEFKNTVLSGAQEQYTDAVHSTVSTEETIGTRGGILLQADAGEIWEYGVKILGNGNEEYGKDAKAKRVLRGGVWDGEEVEIIGLTTDMRKTVGSVGTVTQLSNQNRVYVDSKQAGTIKIESAIQNKRFEGVKFSVKGKEYPNAGDASTATTISKQLTITVVWGQTGQQISFVNNASVSTTGRNYAVSDRTSAKVPVYIRISDAYGNNINDKKIKVKVENGAIDRNELESSEVAKDKSYIVTGDSISVTEAEGLKTSNGSDVTSNAPYGIVKLYVNGTAGSDYTTVTATDMETNQSAAYTITWTNVQKFEINDETLGGTSTYATRYDGADKITLTFNQNIVESSVMSGCFRVYYGKDDSQNDKEYKISSVELTNGNQIVLTIPEFNKIGIGRDSVIKVKFDTQNLLGGVNYRLTSVNGDVLSCDDITKSYIVFNVSQDTKPITSEEK